MNGILIVAHAPLAQALRLCALHVFPDCGDAVQAVDVQAQDAPEDSLDAARAAMARLQSDAVLVLTDLFGATPCNVAQRLVDGQHSRLLTGVNLPMLLRSISYRHESLDNMLTRAMAGGTQGVLQVSVTAPQNQAKSHHHDHHSNHHQQ